VLSVQDQCYLVSPIDSQWLKKTTPKAFADRSEGRS
jgi:hypothetical protein